MKRLFILSAISIACLSTIPGSAQNFEWAQGMGGANSDAGYAVALDGFGNVYTTGGFQGTVDFDPGAGVSNLTSLGSDDIFITKSDANGNFYWAKSMGSATGYDDGTAIAVDASGNVYCSGIFGQTVDFDPGAGTFNLTSNGSDDIFVCKLDATGSFLWAKSFGAGTYDAGLSLTLDAASSVIITGYFTGTVDFDPGAGTNNLTAPGFYYDAFILKLDTYGNHVWAKQIGSTRNEIGHSISLDGLGNIYTSGVFAGTVDFDPGAGVFNMSSPDSATTALYVSKLDANGTFLWARSVAGAVSINAGYIASDGAGNVVVTGAYDGTVDFDPGANTINMISTGGYDMFMFRLDASGNFAWVVSLGEPTNAEAGYSVDIDPAGFIFITGVFTGTVDFNPGAGTTNLTSGAGQDIFVCKFDWNGDLVWANAVGGPQYEYSFGIAVDGANNVFVTGQFQNTADVDPGAGVFSLTSAGNYDILLLKLSIMGTGMNETEQSNFSLFPNPASTVLNLHTTEAIESVSIFNSTGTLVQTENKNTFSVAELPAGVYLIQLQTASGISTSRFIKE